MAKIRCKIMTMCSQREKAPSGTEYLFHKSHPTHVDDKGDIEHFLKAGKGEYFELVGVKGTVKKVAKKAKEKVTKKVPKTRATVKEEEPKLYTKKDLYALNKREQSELIRKLGGANMRIPRLEKDRVKLLLSIQ